jgi:hypothetical protein
LSLPSSIVLPRIGFRVVKSTTLLGLPATKVTSMMKFTTGSVIFLPPLGPHHTAEVYLPVREDLSITCHVRRKVSYLSCFCRGNCEATSFPLSRTEPCSRPQAGLEHPSAQAVSHVCSSSLFPGWSSCCATGSRQGPDTCIAWKEKNRKKNKENDKLWAQASSVSGPHAFFCGSGKNLKDADPVRIWIKLIKIFKGSFREISVAEPELQGAETFVWSRSRIRVSATALTPGQTQESHS